MSYAVKVSKVVIKQLSNIPKKDYCNIKSSILSLSSNPRPNGYKKLTARDGYRIRVGNYRVIYDIEDSIKIVSIMEVGHRKEIYKTR